MKRADNDIVNITDDIKWIGVRDYDITTFDIVMTTGFGTTYNSYFINARKKTVVEVAKEKFRDSYFDKLKSLTDPAEIEYIILDHTEPDHSGSLVHLLELAPGATVVGSGNAIRFLGDIMNRSFKSLVVKDGDKLDLGNKTLTFIAAPNLHWPDSIYTWCEEDKVLFTCDSFGAHYASENIFSNFTGEYTSAFTYYFNVILRPFSRFMLSAIEKIRPLDIRFICPGHGPVHSKNIQKAIALSEEYSAEYIRQTKERSGKNILVAYVSAYGYTRTAADCIAEGIAEDGRLTAEVLDIENISLDELDARITVSDGIVVGSPTINQNTLLPVYKLFAVLNPLRDKGKLGGAFGSYGWSGEAPKIILENLRLLKLKVFEETGQFKFAPGNSKKEALKAFGRNYATRFHEVCG